MSFIGAKRLRTIGVCLWSSSGHSLRSAALDRSGLSVAADVQDDFVHLRLRTIWQKINVCKLWRLVRLAPCDGRSRRERLCRQMKSIKDE